MPENDGTIRELGRHLQPDEVFGSHNGGKPTSEATQSFVLEMAALTRAAIGPSLLATATVHYGGERFPVELTLDTRSEGPGFIDFAHETRDTSDPQPISYPT